MPVIKINLFDCILNHSLDVIKKIITKKKLKINDPLKMKKNTSGNKITELNILFLNS